jgi:hypothetical protein
LDDRYEFGEVYRLGNMHLESRPERSGAIVGSRQSSQGHRWHGSPTR